MKKDTKKYQIKYTYSTGDSFNTESGVECILELDFDNLDVAKANIQRIKEHWEMKQEWNSTRWGFKQKTKDEIINKNKDKDWFVSKNILVAYKENEKGHIAIDEQDTLRYTKNGWKIKHILDEDAFTHQLIIYTDEGKPYQFWGPWCGYFESLESVEIVISKEDGMKYSFR